MSKTESSAVNKLISEVQGRPVRLDDDDDLGFGERTQPTVERKAPAKVGGVPGAPRARTASGTDVPPPVPANGANGNGVVASRNSSPRPNTLPPPPIPNAQLRQTLPLGTRPAGAPRMPDVKGTPPPDRMPLPVPAPPPSVDPEDQPDWIAIPSIPSDAPTQVTEAPTGPDPALSSSVEIPILEGPSPSQRAVEAAPVEGPAAATRAVEGPAATSPSATRSSAPFIPTRNPSGQRPVVSRKTPLPMRSGQPAPSADATAPAELINGEDWFLDSSGAVPTMDESDIGTQAVRHKKASLNGLLIGVGCMVALAAVFFIGYLYFDGEGGKKKDDKPADPTAAAAAPSGEEPAPTPVEPDVAKAEPTVAKTEPSDVAKTEEPAVAKTEEPAVAKTEEPAVAKTEPSDVAKTEEPAKPAPAPEPAKPAPAPAPEPGGVPALVEVLFVSSPPNANVVLVDGSRTIPIGPTPVKASIDSSKDYEAVFALEGHKTRITKLDAERARRVEVDLRSGKTKVTKAELPKVAKVEPPKPAPAPAPAPAKVEPPKPAPAKVEPPKVAAKVVPPKKRSSSKAKSPSLAKRLAEVSFDDDDTAAGGTGKGTLMINAKPPCEILVDGRSTGLTTPQRDIPLPAGLHKVTLVNAEAGIRKTLMVKINPNKSTRVSQDLSADIK